MRILLVVNTLPHTDISGVGEQVVQLASGLRSLGHEVRILGRGTGGAPGPKVLFPISILPAFLRHLAEFRPHVVQVHESDGALVALLTKTLQASLEPRPSLMALLQVSYLEEMRAVRPLYDGGRVLGRPGPVELGFRWLKAPAQVLLGQLTAWLSDRVLSPSHQTALEIARDYAVRDVAVLPNVTGADRVDGQGEPPLMESDYLLFVGRLRIRKGLEVLLHALADLDGPGAQAKLVIIGDGEHRPRVQKLVSKLGLDSRVVMPGRCAPGQIRGVMARARALVVPSIYEGMPLVILEAMAAGLPIVASRVSGIPEVVEDGASGWLVPPEEVGALRAALSEVLENPVEAAKRGRRGRELVASSATPVDAARRWEQLVTRSAGGNPEDG